MHRLELSLCVLGLSLAAACGGGTKEPETAKTKTESSSEAKPAETKGTSESAEKSAPAAPVEKKDVCVGASIADLEERLTKSDCEVPEAKPDSVPNPDMKGKLEIAVTASPTKVAPGGKVDIVVTFTNKTNQPMPLSFRIDPVPRFETETYDAKKKRADMPAGAPPPPPKGHSAPPPAEAKVGRVTLTPNGSARVKVAWEAVKMKWAPDKVRGTAAEKGYPRVPAGPLAKGKYNVKIVTPLVGVFEGGEREVSSPKIEIEVGG